MVDFAPGMRTIIRDEEWMVKKIEKNNLGNQALHCIGISALVKDKEVIFLTDLEDIKVVNPAEVHLIPDTSSHFRRTQLYLESQWRQQIPTDTDLHIGDKAAMDLMPYQLEPAQISLRRPRQRILIADTVGLGKTLEAGILMSELIVRGKGKRILVVTVKSMMTQFQKEMWNRFTIPLVRLDSKKIRPAMGIPDVLDARDNAPREGNVLAAKRIADCQHVVLHMRRLADFHGRDALHESRLVHTDKCQVGIIVNKFDRAVIEHVLVVLADADVAGIRHAMRAGENAPWGDYDARAR